MFLCVCQIVHIKCFNCQPHEILNSFDIVLSVFLLIAWEILEKMLNLPFLNTKTNRGKSASHLWHFKFAKFEFEGHYCICIYNNSK